MAKIKVTPADVAVFKGLISATEINVEELKTFFDRVDMLFVPTENRCYDYRNLRVEFKPAHNEVKNEKQQKKIADREAKQTKQTNKRTWSAINTETGLRTAAQLGIDTNTKAKVTKELNAIIKKVNKIDTLVRASL